MDNKYAFAENYRSLHPATLAAYRRSKTLVPHEPSIFSRIGFINIFPLLLVCDAVASGVSPYHDLAPDDLWGLCKWAAANSRGSFSEERALRLFAGLNARSRRFLAFLGHFNIIISHNHAGRGISTNLADGHFLYYGALAVLLAGRYILPDEKLSRQCEESKSIFVVVNAVINREVSTSSALGANSDALSSREEWWGWKPSPPTGRGRSGRRT